MPIPAVEVLKDEIYALPEQLNQALGQKVEAELEAARLEAGIKKLEAQLKKEEEQKEDQEDDESGNNGLIELEDKLKRLRNELTETESKVELDYRDSRRDSNQKVTESQVKAAVRNDENVKRLKREISQQEIKIRTHKSTQRGRQRVYIPRRPYGRSDIESPELDSLREELSVAEGNSMKADIEVKTLQTKLEAFKLLVQLITH